MVASYHRLVFGSSNVCKPGGFLYIACDLSEGIVYVGQTASQTGVLGRWLEHFRASNAGFRRRLAEWDEDALDRLSGLVVVYWLLGQGREFAGLESSYREGVEYLVQVGMHRLCAELKAPLRVLSTVRTNTTVQQAVVIEAATRVLDCVRTEYPTIFRV